MKSLLLQWRAHGNREPLSPGRTDSPPARSRHRGWRPLLAAAFTAALLALTATAAFAQGVWQTLPSTPTAQRSLAGATAPCPRALHRTCVYAIGGDNVTSYLNTVQAYSPATNTWATLPSLPTARTVLAGATGPCPGALHRACVYAIGGNNGGYLNTVQAYSPATNTWATLPSMPTARSDLAAATAPCPRGNARLKGTCVYAIGGGGYPGPPNIVQAYSPATNTWATLPSLPTARTDLAAATAPCPGTRHRTCVYAIGGDNGSGVALNAVEAYSPATNTWATLPSLPTARYDLAGATAPCPGDRHRVCVYAVGGSTNSITGLNTVEAYSPATNTWATLPSMPTARWDLAGATAPCTAARHRTCVYAIDGFNGANVLNTVEAFEVGR
jgi:hypothetical protein